jgi:hypothetical protein
MKVAELIELLQGLPDDAEVRIAQQPSWPFEYSITGAVIVGGGFTEDEDEDEAASSEPVVYLAEGSQLGYLPGNVSRELGWR